TPLYGVETDLLGDFIPAARALRAGQLAAAHFEFKGPGYPALLAVAGMLVGDDWLAARLLNVLGAVAGAWFAWRVATRFLGRRAGRCVSFPMPPGWRCRSSPGRGSRAGRPAGGCRTATISTWRSRFTAAAARGTSSGSTPAAASTRWRTCWRSIPRAWPGCS